MTKQKVEASKDKSFDNWSWEQTKIHGSVSAIKGPPDPGECYDDGDLITNPVNYAWESPTEIFWLRGPKAGTIEKKGN